MLTLGIPFAIAYAVGGTWQAGVEGLVWGGLIRIAAYQHATFSVNSICHMFGRQDYRSRDEARNNWLVAVLVFGEGWHNNHHAFPVSARHGLTRRQVDLSWLVIRALERLRLVWNVKVPDAAQLERRRRSAGALKERQLVGDETSPACPHEAAARHGPSARAARLRGPRRGSACSRSSTPSARARSKPRRELAGETPGMPGSQRSSEPWSTRSRRPRSGSSESRSGSHGARPSTVATDGAPAACTATAPPIEKPSRSVRPAPSASIASSASSTHRSSRFHDLIRYLTSPNASDGKRGASARASHSSEALHVPSTSPAWPPFTQTTTAAAATGGPVTRSSAPLGSRSTRVMCERVPTRRR